MSARYERFLVHSAKNLLQPINLVPHRNEITKDELSKSHRLMLDVGIIRQAGSGTYHLLPLGLRSLNKLKAFIDYHMLELGAQKIQMPIMTSGNIWKTSSRWNSTGLELFKLKDRRGKDYLLGPTHEESVADLLASIPTLSYQHFPLLLYQTTMKFRDEIKPRCALLRSREFLMKDLYSFDISVNAATNTYNSVCDIYDKIFSHLCVPYYKVLGNTNDMGGESSHEYHIPSDIGEDTLYVCELCNRASNSQLASSCKCVFCGHTDLKHITGIEVGHTFLLGTKYSEPFNTVFKDKDNSLKLLVMGSYGLGLTRILTATVEYLSLQDQLRWPQNFAPFTVVIITPKDGSKESERCSGLGFELYRKLSSYSSLADDVLLDDRGHLTIGRRIRYAKQTGYPFLIVIGASSTKTPPIIELQNLFTGETLNMSINELVDYFGKHQILAKTS